jgi:anti-sigma regulatory factor (Ser/Thr protein kinase)
MERTFPAESGSVQAVRQFVRGQCAAAPARLLADVALVASELATNVVQYARTTFDVNVELQKGEVLLEVTDTGRGTPRLAPKPSRTATHSRGLRIVDALADAWGVRPARPGPGKTVWVRLTGDHLAAAGGVAHSVR